MENARKNMLGSAKIVLDKSERNGKSFIIIKPDPDQDSESREIASKFINRIFLKQSVYQSGMTSIPESIWRNKKAEKFIKAMQKSKITLSWRDISPDGKIMKGLSIYQSGEPSMPSSPFGNMGGMGGFQPSQPAGFSSPDLTPQVRSQTSASIISNPNISPGPSSAPAPESPPVQQSNYEIKMKNLILLWENYLNEI